MPTLKGTEVSLSYVQCFLYLVSSLINVSIFHVTWLDTFWTYLVYHNKMSFYFIRAVVKSTLTRPLGNISFQSTQTILEIKVKIAVTSIQ